MWGRALGGRAVYVVGFTGLGVGASRFGARVGLDLLDGLDTERTRLEMVRRRPIPFPPEPARWAGIAAHAARAGAGRPHARDGAGRGCARSTGSASASTPERVDCPPNER